MSDGLISLISIQEISYHSYHTDIYQPIWMIVKIMLNDKGNNEFSDTIS